MGSVCEYLKDERDPLPAYVYLPCYLGWGQSIRRPGPYAGFLGKRYDPLFTECSPYIDKDAPPERPGYPQVLRGEPRLPDSTPGEGITLDRLHARRTLLQQFDDQVRRAEGHPALGTFDRHQARAFELLTSAKVKAAFDLDDEDPKLRDRYGRTLFGSSALIARRLVEAGVRFVNVTWDCYWERLQLQYDGWDTHTRNFPILREYNLPQLDLTLSALLEDLDGRGLLDETLVVVMSDMGRTPKINGSRGPRPLDVLLLDLLRRRGHPRRHGLRRVRRAGGLRQGQPRQHRRHLRHHLPLPGDRSRDDRPRPDRPADADRERRQPIREILA